VRRTIAAIGRTLVTLGLLILLFVAYQLWGTGIYTARAQTSLKHDFAKAQQAYRQENDTVGTPSTTKPGATTTTVSPVRKGAPPATPPEGQVEGLIRIPRIGLSMAFVEGVSRDDLKKGPGHYPDTPPPGTLGNAAIAGHRTTYLHPFYDVDKMQPGDDIIIQTIDNKTFTYEMTQQLIVKPTDTWVVDNTPDAQLTLTSCNPRYSAEERIVIKVVANKSAKPTKAPPASSAGKSHGRDPLLEEGLSSETKSVPPAIVWGSVVFLVGLAWWWAFRRWRHPLTWVTGVIPFLVVLFAFYVYLERAIPQGLYSG
jgi:sortase A